MSNGTNMPAPGASDARGGWNTKTQSLPSTPVLGMVHAPVKGVAMPAPGLSDARSGWNTKQA